MSIRIDKMPFGKYKELDMEEVPADYLMWLSEQDWIEQYPRVLSYINRNKEGIKKEVEDIKEGY